MREVEKRIALLIDADNAPAAKIDDILTELSTVGVINIRRAYGNWTKNALDGWQDKLLECAIQPVQQFDYSKRKNATDMAMTVDAMQLLYTERPDVFGIVSSDADFTPLVMHLRFKGAVVYGFGQPHTPQPFVNACSKFLYLQALGTAKVLDSLRSSAKDSVVVLDAQTPPIAAGPLQSTLLAPGLPEQPAVTKLTSGQLQQDGRLMQLLRDAVRAAKAEDGWSMVSAVGGQIANKTPFDSRNYGYSSLSKLLRATEVFELRGDGTPRVAARDMRYAPPKVTPAAKLQAGQGGVLAWPVTMRRHNGPPLSAALHSMRSVLLELAASRTTIADILEAVPELATGQPCVLASVASRLREYGLLDQRQSVLRLLQRHPQRFEVSSQTLPQVVRYLA